MATSARGTRVFVWVALVGAALACSSGSPGGSGSACGEGVISSACSCQGEQRSSGYCCGDVWQAAACAQQSAGGLLDPDHTTSWNPGIKADVDPGAALGTDGLPVRTTVCKTLAPSQAFSLQSTLNGCASGTVVVLQSGTFTVPSTINVPSGVVLRGQASSGANATILSLASGASGPVVAIGPEGIYDQACYADHFGNAVPLTADAVKEQNKISIAANETTFKAGDHALLDEANTGVVNDGDCGGAFKRAEGRTVEQRVQIASVDTSTGTLTLTDPLHWTFRKSNDARVSKVTDAVTSWAGVEHLWVQNGRGLGEYLGRKAGGIDISSAAYCWVKDVQTDGTLAGMHVTLTGALRCVVRDSHFHNSKIYGFGQDNYGIVLRCGAADNLVENNIARYMNKPILFSNSGGGNVVGYNYGDNSWSLDSNGGGAFQETAIDCHCSYPHMELIEGNYAPHMGASITHGNAGNLTYFRNYASSQQAPSPIVWSQAAAPQTGNVTALQFDASDNYMTVIGNVLGSTTRASLGVPTSLGTATVTQEYMSYDGSPSIFALGGPDDISATSLWWHGNFDTGNGKVMWNSKIDARTVPASLYRASKPAWWPSDKPWPWVGPDLNPMVGVLPAQAAAAAFNYNTANDPSCTPNVSDYSCQ